MTLTFLQWNIRYKENTRSVAAFLKAHPADVICLQELTLQDIPEVGNAAAYIAEQLGYYHYAEIADLGPGKIPVGSGIFSRFPIVSTRTVWISETRGDGGYDDQPRPYVEVTLQAGEQQLAVATVHMSYTHAFVSTPRKQEETQRLVDILKTKQRKFVFTGDLNAAPDSPTVKAVAGVLQNIGPDFNEKTWTTKPFSYEGFGETELNWRLDYIFATKDVKTISAEILQTKLSDHLPVRAVVEYVCYTKGA